MMMKMMMMMKLRKVILLQLLFLDALAVKKHELGPIHWSEESKR